MVNKMWARIENDIVAEVTDIDPAGRFHPSFVWVACSGDVQPGWLTSGESFTAPELPHPTAAQLCQQVDIAADAARRAVAGDPLRAVEYDKAAEQAQAFAAAEYLGDVPPMVAAWAIGGRTAQQAADSILAEAAQYNTALVQLRTVRLNAKELIRNAMAAGNTEQAEDIAAETIASIEAAVAGIGNNA